VDPALQELLDARAIEQLMIRYIDGIDASDPVGAAACFAPDGVGIDWGEYRGREAIAERLRGVLAGFDATSHHLSDVQPAIDGDRATSQAYVDAFHRRAGSGDQLHDWGRWVDVLRRIDGEWCFERQEVVGVGTVEPGDAERHRPHPGHPGRLPHLA